MNPYGGTNMAQIARERDQALRENERLREALDRAEVEMASVAQALHDSDLSAEDAADMLARQCEVTRRALASAK